MNKYSYIYDYIPTTSTGATERQVKERNEILDFMDGSTSRGLRDALSSKVREVTSEKNGDYVIAFIPSWSSERTVQRFGSLARYLSETTHIEAYLDAIALSQEGDPVLKTKDMTCNPNRVKGKDVILIGSIYMTGKTHKKACELLQESGARSIHSVFMAKIGQLN